MATKAQKVRLSVFLIMSVTVFLVFFFILVGGKMLQRMETYNIVYRDVTITGLEVGAQVKLNGVPVGRVSGLTADTAETVRVTIEVKPKSPIKTDTKAILNYVGITGLKYVELSGGSDTASSLPPGGTIQAGQSIFDTLSGSANVIIEKLEMALNNITKMTGPENTKALNSALISFAGVSAQLDTLFNFSRPDLVYAIATLDSTMTEFYAISLKANNLLTAMDNIMSTGDIQATLSNTRRISESMRAQTDSLNLPQLTDDIHTLMQNTNATVTHYDLLVLRGRDDILQALRNMNEALDNLREATDLIRENPSVIIRGRSGSQNRTD